MVTLYKANTVVKGGTYFNLKQGEFVNIPEKEGFLPGKDDVRYVRVPAAAMLVLGPLFGLLLVVFLPLAVPLVLLSMAAKKLGGKTRGVREAAMHMTVPTQVGVAAVHRGKAAAEDETPGSDKPERAEIDDLIARLEQEINERRHNEH